MPVRKIPIQTRSKSGYFYSYKNGRSIAYESLLEKKCFLMLEFEEEIASYEEQPLKIKNYIPDVLAKTKDGKYILIEVKYSQETENPDKKLSKKFDVLEKYCNNIGWKFRLFTEKDVKEPYFSNLSFIYRYITLKPDEKILSYVDRIGETNIAKLLEYGFDASDIYALIAQGRMQTNLYKKLSPESRIRIGNA
ncbi:TnsA endonuclease N-terminal domain-containing protein [Nitrosophilus labii]|uniref:TnsA endonuclease N-terminal domain-containing protein n=1 Tax=Nitrosophilus labii TaxID=2706014 RepID=UPI001656F2A8|nr:TnsA endonuclease N-terminal domain-containing protein [Nitrosophilus labii]